MLFTAAGATIYDRDSKVINFSPKALDDRIWTFAPSSASCNNVIRHDLYASYTEYAHATFGSPSNSTMRKAIAKGYLRTFPRLTLSMWDRNPPNSTATPKGHLDLNRSNQRSTTVPEVEPDDADESSATPFTDNVMCFIRSLRDEDTNFLV